MGGMSKRLQGEGIFRKHVRRLPNSSGAIPRGWISLPVEEQRLKVSAKISQTDSSALFSGTVSRDYPASYYSKSSARWIRWLATRLLDTFNSAGAARAATIS